MYGNLENLRKKIFIGKKSNSKKRGVFGRKKGSLISLKMVLDDALVILMCLHSVFCDVISLSGKKSNLKFENLEFLVQIPNE